MMIATNVRTWRLIFFFSLVVIWIDLVALLIYFDSTTVHPSLSAPTSTPTTTPPVVVPTSTSLAPTPKPTQKPVPIPPPTPVPAALPTPPPIVVPSDPLAYKFGISTGDTLPWMSQEKLNKELDDIASLGVGWVRLDMAWDEIQPYNSVTYDWSGLDRVFAAANARHIKLLPILDYTPRWARSPNCSIGTNRCPPADPALFGTFAKAAVDRYAPQGVHAWEIWNEPNVSGSWKPEANIKDYVALLRIAYSTIKSRDALSTVITGGMSPAATGNGNISPIEFLTNLYLAGAREYFDAVGFHPYSYPVTPSNFQTWNAWSQMASTTPSLRSIMITYGDGDKKIWMTEYGAPTGGPGTLADLNGYDASQVPDHVTDTLQAKMMYEAITAASNFPWAGPLFWYSY